MRPKDDDPFMPPQKRPRIPVNRGNIRVSGVERSVA